jgi:predicted TIM-barrel enzyme
LENILTQVADLADVFGQTKVFLPVIHIATVDQALRSADVAVGGGADGVFVISHEGDAALVLAAARAIHRENRDLWIGANFLGAGPVEAFDLAANSLDGTDDAPYGPIIAGVWSDNAEIDERSSDQPHAEAIVAGKSSVGFEGLYFGGVAFKHQRPVDDVASAGAVAARYMDVVTTSGLATGRPADLDKIVIMSQAVGETPLGIASGVDVTNVGDYTPYVDVFLVSTGISSDFHNFDAAALSFVGEAIHS